MVGDGGQRRHPHRARRMRALSALWRDGRKRARGDRGGASVAGGPRRRCGACMPAGAARNALDCALWDLEAKRAGKPAWALAGLPGRRSPVVTAYTLSLGTPEAMAEAARAAAEHAAPQGEARRRRRCRRIRAVRAAAPLRALIVDANEAWNEREFRRKHARLRRGRRRADRAAAAGRRRRHPARRARIRCRSAPTRACTSPPTSKRSPANTTASTSSSTRPAA